MWLGDQSTSLNAVGVIGFWLQLGFCVVLLLSGIGGIDQSLYEAAAIDGVNAWQNFWQITFPLIGPFFTINMVLSLKNSLFMV